MRFDVSGLAAERYTTETGGTAHLDFEFVHTTFEDQRARTVGFNLEFRLSDISPLHGTRTVDAQLWQRRCDDGELHPSPSRRSAVAEHERASAILYFDVVDQACGSFDPDCANFPADNRDVQCLANVDRSELANCDAARCQIALIGTA